MSILGNKSDLYQYAIDQASIVSITDGEGKITYVNDNFCKISGYTREELIGHDHRIVNSGFHRKDFFTTMWEGLKEGHPWAGDVCNRSKDGTLYWVRTNITPVTDDNGNVVGMISIRQDITQSKKIENLFTEESNTLKFVLDSYEAGMFQYFYKENKVNYDQTCMELLGTSGSIVKNSLDNFLSLFSTEDQASLKFRFKEHLKGEKESFSHLCYFKNNQSDAKNIMIRGKVIRRDHQGNPEILVGMITDLTEQMKLESLLVRTQKVAKIGAWEYILDDNTLNWSPAIYELYGYEPYSIKPNVDFYYNSLIKEEDRDFVANMTVKAIESKEVQQIDIQALRSDGAQIWVRHIIYPETIGGRVFKLYGTTQDISDQKELEINLSQSMRKVDMALETAGFGIGEIIYKDRKIIVDDYLKNLMGLDHIEGKIKYSDLKKAIILEDFVDLNTKYLKAFEKNKAVINTQFRVLKEDGVLSFIQARSIIDYEKPGVPRSILGLFWDITQDKEFENILIETKNKAEEATKMKSSFLASMSHEIRTPMNGVLGMLDLLSDTTLTREQKKLVDTMKVCSDNLLTVVNDVLDFSKIEAGKIEFEYRKFNLIDMIEKLSVFFKVMAQKKGVELTLKMDKSLPRYIEIDEVRLKQVLTNLISNALKFTSKGSVEILAYSNQPNFNESNADTTQGSVTFMIKDSGIGIEKSQMEKLFTSFSQVDSSTTRKYGGTGLGLAISKSLVEKMGGEIKVRSEKGKGSTFKFNILCSFYQDIENELGDVASIFPYRKDIRILVAEDNAINQTLVKAIFKKLDLEIELAANGKIAYNMVRDNKYDVVFMDLQMPIMDGIMATTKINGDDEILIKPLIVAMTANVFQEDKNRCFSVGMSDFIPKPLSRKNILSVLSRYFPDYDGKPLEVEVTMSDSNSKYKLINSEQILFEFEEDFDIFEELFSDYQSRFTIMVDEIRRGYERGSSEEVKVGAHTLKGVVANFYSDELTDSAFQMELSAKNGDLSSLLQQLNMFLNYNDGVIAELHSFIQDFKGKKSSEAA